MTEPTPLRLGTRASPLAMAQAHLTVAALTAAHPGLTIELKPMTATGDRILDRALAEVGGKALWTRELDAALGENEIDFAVHSMKDVETLRPAAFHLAAMLPRADVRDRLIVRSDWDVTSIADLPHGARVGTSSPRRAAQLLSRRPDLATPLLRGNVQTRLARVADGTVDATLLAAAGLDRLGMVDVGIGISISELLPAASQGAVGIECRADDAATITLLSAIDDSPTRAAVNAERALLAALGGDCRSPVAAHAHRDAKGDWMLHAILYSDDGREQVVGQLALLDPDAPAQLAQQLLAQASPAIRALFTGG
jgi:hydroxymethylbilane synthase